MEQQLIKPDKVDQHSDVQSRDKKKRETQDVPGLESRFEVEVDGLLGLLKRLVVQGLLFKACCSRLSTTRREISAVRAKFLRRKIFGKNRRNDESRLN